ncbi:hypothetical protein HN51_060945 [Arachis hypogaea]
MIEKWEGKIPQRIDTILYIITKIYIYTAVLWHDGGCLFKSGDLFFYFLLSFSPKPSPQLFFRIFGVNFSPCTCYNWVLNEFSVLLQVKGEDGCLWWRLSLQLLNR